MVGTPEGVIEFLAQKADREREAMSYRASHVVRLDLYVGETARYRDIVALLRGLATEIEGKHAAYREAGLPDRDLIGRIIDSCKECRQKLATMHPTIKRDGVPNSEYRKKQ